MLDSQCFKFYNCLLKLSQQISSETKNLLANFDPIRFWMKCYHTI